MVFYLNCWVPSLQNYVKIKELTVGQLCILSKYIVNDDDAGINSAFDEIIQDSLQNKEIFNQLDRLDKWFVLCFLKCNNISPQLIIKAKTADGADCTIDYSLVDILTRVSEQPYRLDSLLEVKNFKATFTIPKSLFLTNVLTEAVAEITLDDKKIGFENLSTQLKQDFFVKLDKSLVELLNAYVRLQDESNSVFLIQNTQNLKNVFDIKLNLFDNTLFAFLKSIFYPYAQTAYVKKYNLLKIGLRLEEIDKLTPFETDIYQNIYQNEEKALAEKKIAIR